MSAAKAKGLGRGLDALLGPGPGERGQSEQGRGERAEEAPARPRARSTLPIEFLAPNPDQPRRLFNEDALDELAASIRAQGLLQPILVRPAGPDRFEIVAGERRWRAAQRAQLHEVPVVIRELDDASAAEIALIENVQRVDLNPVEEARAYLRLVEAHGRTHDEIARAVGKSRSHVSNIIRLLDLPDMLLAALLKGEITMGHARALLGAKDPEKAARRVMAEGLSVRETERIARDGAGTAPARGALAAGGTGAAGSSSEHGSSDGGRKGADTRALEADLAAVLGLEVEIENGTRGAGAITLHYRSLDQLDDICRRLTGASV